MNERATPPRERPNILLILADSMQAQVMGAYGGACRTPHADRLANEGVCFSHAFTTAPICHPARASIATGLLPHGHGFIANRCGKGAYPFNVLPGTPTLAELLSEAGYRCGYAGQGHIDVTGYHDDRSIPTAEFAAVLRERGLAERPVPEQSFRGCGRLALSAEDARDTDFAKAAVGLLDEYAGIDEPWFIQCDFDGPHPPCYVPVPFDEMHVPADVRIPTNLRDPLADKPAVHTYNRRAQGTARWSEDDWRTFLVHYYGMVSFIDSLVGRVLDKLDAVGAAGNTLVILTSDHGGLCGAHGLLTHGTPAMFREVMQTPLIARWPGRFAAETRREEMLSHVDLLPTLLDAARACNRVSPHGRSWLELAEGGVAAGWPECVLGQYHGTGAVFHSTRMLRTERWNYLWHPLAGEEVYDLQSDPDEMDNLAGRTTAGPVVWELRRMLGEEMKRTEDPLADSSWWRALGGV